MRGGLYKNRYLIAIYDDQDNLLELYDNSSEIANRGNIKIASLHEILSHQRKRAKFKRHYILIDCLEVHDDVFKEEDENFIEFAKEVNLIKKSANEKAAELGISERTYYRKIYGK